MFGRGRFVYRQLELAPKRFEVRFSTRYDSADLIAKVPKRVERKPTDILKALASTVQRDPTSFHYKYPDDPYFYAQSHTKKRVLALSLESGRKSAKWIVKNNPGFFKHMLAEPPIKAYNVESLCDEDSAVKEEALINYIRDRNVSSSISVYNNLLAKGISLSNDTKQLLLELICFYNCDEKQDEENLEMKWYQGFKKRPQMNTWKDGGFAEKLYESMDSDCPFAFSALIQGMLKHNQVNKAVELLKTRPKNMKLTVGVYNELLAHVNNIMEGGLKRWEYMEHLLREMSEKNIQPNLGTLNAVLESLAHISGWNLKERVAWKTMAEFKKLGIEPSLGSYFYLIDICCDKRSKESTKGTVDWASSLIENLQAMQLELRHPSDMFFFPYVMSKCYWPLKNCELANNLNRLLWTNDNVKFLKGNYEENVYFKNYFSVVFQGEPIEYAMEIFTNYVPTVYSPEASVYEHILKAISLNGALEFLPEIWRNLKEQRLDQHFEILTLFLKTVPFLPKEGDVPIEICNEVAAGVWMKLEKADFNLALIGLDDFSVSHLLALLVKGKEEEKALFLFERVQAAEEESMLKLTGSSLEILSRFLLTKNNISGALDCLKYAAAKQYPETKEIASNVLPYLSNLKTEDFGWVVDLVNLKEQEQLD